MQKVRGKVIEDPANKLTDSFNFFHQIKLWNLMMPNTPLKERITKQWGDIGFQGRDPQTDFRGMGMLSCSSIFTQ